MEMPKELPSGGRRRVALAVAVTAALTVSGPARGVEVYRIGGEALPRPQGVGVQFHQLSWSDFEEVEGVDRESLAQGVVRPLFIDEGVNLAATAVDRGGGPYVRVSGVASYSVTTESKTMLDRDPTTAYTWVVAGAIYGATSQSHRITLDLGGVFPVSRLRMFPKAEGQYPDKLEVAISSALQSKDTASGYGIAVLLGEKVYNLRENTQDTIDVSFPQKLARTVDLLLTRLSTKEVTVAEVEVYGVGYTKEAAYVGPLIDLGEPAVWGDLRWGGRKEADARVHIQTRSGQDGDANVYWRYTGRGNETTRLKENGQPLDGAAYALLKPGENAGITYDTDNWSFWSAPYGFQDSSGTPVQSPGPKSVFQLRIDFLPTVLQGGEVGWVEFWATKPPLAEDVVGEVYPAEVILGNTTRFTYAIRPAIRAIHSGFDRVELVAPFGLEAVEEVRIGGAPVEYQLERAADDPTRFAVRLPRKLRSADSGGVVEIDFTAPVLRYGTTFDGWVRDTERPGELPQRINPGDAAAELLGEGLRVRTIPSAHLLSKLTVSSRTVTPNGDGINDRMQFSFSVLQLTDESPLKLEIFDLSGRRVKVVHQGPRASGQVELEWDGRDGAGQVVAPGVYVYRLAVQAESGEDHASGTVAVVH